MRCLDGHHKSPGVKPVRRLVGDDWSFFNYGDEVDPPVTAARSGLAVNAAKGWAQIQ